MIMNNGVEMPDTKPKTLKELKEMISRFSLSARVDEEGTVIVEEGIGSAQYLAKGPAEVAWLSAYAQSIERRGFLTLYYLGIDK